MMNFRFCIIILSIFLTINLYASKVHSISTFEKEFNIQIILENTFQSTYNASYEKLENKSIVTFYIDSILSKELRKYPKHYFAKINLEQIIICKQLTVSNQRRAAMPDPIKKTLAISIAHHYDKEYLIHVLHHEMHHISEYSLWQDMFYKWNKWSRKKPKSFVYGTGGSSAYENENKEIDWYEINHPKLGFVNLYSTLGQEEDRCEIVVLLMTDSEKILLKEFIQTDKHLKRKVNLTLRTLAKLSDEKLKYWKAKLN